VDGRAVEAQRIIIATAVAPVVPEIPGLGEAGFETNETAMDLQELPRSMVVAAAQFRGTHHCPLTSCICVHPTLSEGVKSAAASLASVL
jgi:mercuric reductase